MKYAYRFRLNKNDLWLYYMTDRYSSFAGFVQVVFIVSMALLIGTKGKELGGVMLLLSVLAFSLFTVVQPVIFYLKASRSVDPFAPETELDFSESEMTVRVQNHVQHLKYEDLVQVISKPGFLVVQVDRVHIYILPRRVLGETKKELWRFLKEKVSS